MAFPWVFANLAAGNTPASKLDDNFNALGAISTVPGVLTGTNAITHTPATNSPTASAYTQLQAYRGIAAATSTGAVTFQVNALSLLACYKSTTSGPVACSTGDIVIGESYDFVYDSALNTGAGGFHVYNVAPTSAASGTIVKVYVATPYTANADLSTTIPLDDTIPQSTEGTQILSVAVTTTTTTQKVWCMFSGWGGGSTNNYLIAALFNGAANAIQTALLAFGSPNVASTSLALVELDWVDAPGAATTKTYSIRVGANTGTIRMNGTPTGRLFGGSASSNLICIVYEP